MFQPCTAACITCAVLWALFCARTCRGSPTDDFQVCYFSFGTSQSVRVRSDVVAQSPWLWVCRSSVHVMKGLTQQNCYWCRHVFKSAALFHLPSKTKQKGLVWIHGRWTIGWNPTGPDSCQMEKQGMVLGPQRWGSKLCGIRVLSTSTSTRELNSSICGKTKTYITLKRMSVISVCSSKNNVKE